MDGKPLIFCFKQKTAYGVRISDWSSDVCSSDQPVPAVLDILDLRAVQFVPAGHHRQPLGEGVIDRKADIPGNDERVRHAHVAGDALLVEDLPAKVDADRKSTRLNSSH